MVVVCFGAVEERGGDWGRVGFVGYFRDDFVAVRAILDDELPIIFFFFFKFLLPFSFRSERGEGRERGGGGSVC